VGRPQNYERVSWWLVLVAGGFAWVGAAIESAGIHSAFEYRQSLPNEG